MISVASHEAQPQISTHPPGYDPMSPEKFIFRSRFPDIAIPDHLPLHDYCFERVSEFADRPFLIAGSTGKTYTFSETHLICRRTAAGLSSLGVGRGDVIMLLLQNCPEFAFAFLAASMVGAAATTANPFCTPSEIHKQFKASGAKLVVTQSQFVGKLCGGGFPEIGADLTVVTVDESPPPENCLHFWELSGGADEQGIVPDVSIDPDDTVALPFSSGTTGLTKGVMLTHRSLVASVALQVDGDNPNLHLNSGDVVLCLLPVFHIYSLNFVLLCSLRVGAAVLLVQRFEIGTLLGLIERHRVTVAPLVPPIVLALARSPAVEGSDLSSVRMVISGAAPLGSELEEALRRRVPQAIIGQGYGMTEAGPLTMCPAFAMRPLPAKSGSCGAVVRNTELRVVDPNTGVPLRRNRPGEICIRGPHIMKGYLNNPEATAEMVDVEGWLHTGDVGYVDDEDEVFIVDRVKELIKFKGFQVPPAELEALLVSHPSIADAAVVPLKDEVAGEVPVAFVVRSDEGFELTEDVVREFVAKQVVYYKRVHRVYFIHAIPKSPAGKILRKDLRAKLATYS